MGKETLEAHFQPDEIEMLVEIKQSQIRCEASSRDLVIGNPYTRGLKWYFENELLCDDEEVRKKTLELTERFDQLAKTREDLEGVLFDRAGQAMGAGWSKS